MIWLIAIAVLIWWLLELLWNLLVAVGRIVWVGLVAIALILGAGAVMFIAVLVGIASGLYHWVLDKTR